MMPWTPEAIAKFERKEPRTAFFVTRVIEDEPIVIHMIETSGHGEDKTAIGWTGHIGIIAPDGQVDEFGTLSVAVVDADEAIKEMVLAITERLQEERKAREDSMNELLDAVKAMIPKSIDPSQSS